MRGRLTRKKKTRSPTLDFAYDHLITEISDLEKSFADSDTNIFLKPRKAVISDSSAIEIEPHPVPLLNAVQETSDRRKQRHVTRPMLRLGTRDGLDDAVRTPTPGLLNRLPVLPASILGPGSYNTHIKTLPRVSQFPLSPRFPMSFTEKVYAYRPMARELTPDMRKELTSRIRDNVIAVGNYSPEARRKTLKIRATLEEVRGSISRAARKEIVKATKRKREEELEAKLRRFEWRLKANEISVGKAKWSGLICAVGLINVFVAKFHVRKVKSTQDLHYRSQGALKFLLSLSLSIGKICLMLKNKRLKKAIAILRRFAPCFTHWVRRHRRKQLESIADTIENGISKNTVYRMIAVWKSRIVLLQRSMKNWLLRRSAQKKMLVLLWIRYEQDSGNQLKSHKVGGYLIQENKTDSTVPLAIKEIIIDGCLKQKVQKQVSAVEKWRSECKDLVEAQRLRLEEDPLLRLPKVEFPPMPKFRLWLTPLELRQLEETAEKKRSRWDRMIKDLTFQSRPAASLLTVP